MINIDNPHELSGIGYIDENIAVLYDLNQLPHNHNHIKINIELVIICVTGNMTISIKGEKRSIQANEMLLCAPNTILKNCMVSSDAKIIIIGLKNGMLFGTMQMENALWKRFFYLKENPVISIAKERVKLFRTYIALLKQRSQTGLREFEKEIMTSMICALLYEIFSEVKTSSNYSNGNLIQQSEVLFKRFISLLSSTQVKPRTVAWYGAELFVTPKYLSTVCKQVSGKTAFEWINEYVLEDINHILKYSTKSIKEIVNLLKFPSVSFFGKYVKRHAGLNPTEYRKRLRNGPTDDK